MYPDTFWKMETSRILKNSTYFKKQYPLLVTLPKNFPTIFSPHDHRKHILIKKEMKTNAFLVWRKRKTSKIGNMYIFSILLIKCFKWQWYQIATVLSK